MSKSKQDEIVQLKNRIQLYKSSLQNPNTFDSLLLSSSAPKKDRIRLWGETLEKIFYLEGRHDEIDSISTIITLELRELNLNKNIPYVRLVLPSKYKDKSQTRAATLLKDSFNCDNNSRQTQPDQDYSKENEPEIKLIKDTISTLTIYLDKLTKIPLLSKVNLLEYDELSTKHRALTTLLLEAMDERDKVLPSKLHLLIHGYAQGTKSHAFTMYLQYMREILKLTTKQASKLLSGRVNKVELLLDPKNKNEARQAGFHGLPCVECGSYRVDFKYNPDVANNMLFCYSCRVWTERTIENLIKKL